MSRDSMMENLRKAVSDGDLGRVKGLCNKLGSFHLKDKSLNGMGFLHYAAISGRTNVCKYLIEDLGFDASIKDTSGCTLLHHACRQGHVATVLYLRNYFANVNEKNFAGATALCLATSEGRTEVMELLLRYGANAKDSTPRGTLLQVSAKRGDEDAVKILLGFNADPNEYNHRTLSPLCGAICAKSLGSVKALLEANADPNAVCLLSTPLHFAASDGVVEMIEELIKRGADPNALDADAYTPLEIAASLSHLEHFTALSMVTREIDYYSNMCYGRIKSELSSSHACKQRILKAKRRVEHQFQETMQFFQHTGDRAGTIAKLSLLIIECPWHSEALLERANLYCTHGVAEYVKVLKDIGACFNVDPENMRTNIKIYRVGAEACLQKRGYQEAINACNIGLRLDANDPKLQEIKLKAAAGMETRY